MGRKCREPQCWDLCSARGDLMPISPGGRLIARIDELVVDDTRYKIRLMWESSELGIMRLYRRHICKVCFMEHTGSHGLVYNLCKVLGASGFHTNHASLASEIDNAL